MNLSPETVIVSGGKSTLIHLNFAPGFWGVLYYSLFTHFKHICLTIESRTLQENILKIIIR